MVVTLGAVVGGQYQVLTDAQPRAATPLPVAGVPE